MANNTINFGTTFVYIIWSYGQNTVLSGAPGIKIQKTRKKIPVNMVDVPTNVIFDHFGPQNGGKWFKWTGEQLNSSNLASTVTIGPGLLNNFC